ncbi:MAG: hypothetical protein R3F62_12615 [Planctomycetota bacterium]
MGKRTVAGVAVVVALLGGGAALVRHQRLAAAEAERREAVDRSAQEHAAAFGEWTEELESALVHLENAQAIQRTIRRLEGVPAGLEAMSRSEEAAFVALQSAGRLPQDDALLELASAYRESVHLAEQHLKVGEPERSRELYRGAVFQLLQGVEAMRARLVE